MSNGLRSIRLRVVADGSFGIGVGSDDRRGLLEADGIVVSCRHGLERSSVPSWRTRSFATNFFVFIN
jgi:hypothetical protein